MLRFSAGSVVDSIGDIATDVINKQVDDIIGSTSPLPSSGGGFTSREYDAYRQQVWDLFATKLVSVVNDYRNRGQLTYAGLSSYIDALQTLMSSFEAGTNQFRTRLSKEWIEPRFHDFYDFMANILSVWRAELQTLPHTILDSITGGGGSNMPPPPIGSNQGVSSGIQSSLLGGNTILYAAVAVGLYLMLRKR